MMKVNRVDIIYIKDINKKGSRFRALKFDNQHFYSMKDAIQFVRDNQCRFLYSVGLSEYDQMKMDNYQWDNL